MASPHYGLPSSPANAVPENNIIQNQWVDIILNSEYCKIYSILLIEKCKNWISLTLKYCMDMVLSCVGFFNAVWK